ncbi:MAG: hypothetical protein AAFQ84_01750 [Pseudomonadota bacterium]
MNYPSVARVLALLGLTLGVCMIGLAVLALSFGERPQTYSFLFSGLLTVTLAAVVIVLAGKPDRPARARDGLAVALIWYVGAPIPAAIPFVFGTAESTIIPAIHEAVSCLTTTGHSVIAIEPGQWPTTLLIWRAILHLFGMVTGLVVAATVFAAVSLGGPGVHRSFLFTIPDGSFFDALPKVIRIVATVCGVLIVIVFSGLVIAGVDPATALGHAVSIASTGLVDPQFAEISYPNWQASMVVFVGLLVATAGLSILLDLAPSRLPRIAVDPELILLLMLIAAIGILAVISDLPVPEAFGWAVSALSTSGLPVFESHETIISRLPPSLLILPALIGGSALSTAGGIKLARIFVLIRRAGQEFARLGYQHSLVALKFRDRLQKERAVLGVWVYLIAYIGAATLTYVFLSFAGTGFDDAIRQSIGAISNSGWLVATPEPHNVLQHIVLSVSMLVGRLEVIAVLSALSPSFWQR